MTRVDMGVQGTEQIRAASIDLTSIASPIKDIL